MCKYLNAYAKCQSTNREIKTAKCLLSNEIAKFSSAKFYRVKFSSAKFSRPTVARVGETGETAANWNNSRPWIGLFQGAKCDNVPKCDLEFA